MKSKNIVAPDVKNSIKNNIQYDTLRYTVPFLHFNLIAFAKIRENIFDKTIPRSRYFGLSTATATDISKTTVIANIVTIVIYLAHVLSKNSTLTINPKYFKISNGILLGVLAIGLPASLTNILMSLSSILTNNLLASYYSVPVASEKLLPLIKTFIDGTAVYGDIPVAAMGVALKANMLTIFIQLGLGIGIAPLIGYNYGAKNSMRVKKIVNFSILVNVVLGVTLTALLQNQS